MLTSWKQITSDMLDVCWKIRNNFPVPSSCSDEQLFEFLNEMHRKWNENDVQIRAGYYDSEKLPSNIKTKYQILVDECCYYEDMIESIEYEISRRTWLNPCKSTSDNNFDIDNE
jgi:hypothetical protein